MILFIKIKLKFFRHVIFSVMKSRQQFIKEITLLIVILAAILASTNLYAQLSAKERKANLYYNRFSYIKAIQRYESINNISVSGLRNLALSYKRTKKIAKSLPTFDQFIHGTQFKILYLFGLSHNRPSQPLVNPDKRLPSNSFESPRGIHEKISTQFPENIDSKQKIHREKKRFREWYQPAWGVGHFGDPLN